MNCPFCGLDYSEEEAVAACGSCVLAANCGRIRCPRCGYEDLRPSRLGRSLGAWRRRSRAGRQQAAADCPAGKTLKEMEPGRKGIVLRLLHAEKRARLAQRLMVLGVLPGVKLEVIRSSPAIVFRIGHSQFAIDDQLARLVVVRPEGGETHGS